MCDLNLAMVVLKSKSWGVNRCFNTHDEITEHTGVEVKMNVFEVSKKRTSAVHDLSTNHFPPEDCHDCHPAVKVPAKESLECVGW